MLCSVCERSDRLWRLLYPYVALTVISLDLPGSFAVQLARWHGCRVLTTCHSTQLDRVQAYQPADVVAFDKENFRERFSGVDAVVECAGGKPAIADSFAVMNRGGTYVTLSGDLLHETDRLGAWQGLSSGLLSLAQLRARYFLMYGMHYNWSYVIASGRNLAQIGRLVEDGTLKLHFDRAFPLEQAKDALAYVAEGRNNGKVALQVVSDA